MEHNVRYLIHNSPPILSVLRQKFPVHALLTHFSLRPTYTRMFHNLPRLYVQSVLCPSCFITITIIPYACYTQRPLHDNPNSILCGVQTIKLINKQSSAILCYFLLLRINYLPQSPVYKYIWSISFPLCERSCFIPIRNKRQYFVLCTLYFDLYIFGEQTGRQIF